MGSRSPIDPRDHLTVPRPRVVRVRMVVPHDLEPRLAHLHLQPPKIVRRDEIAVRIVRPPIDGRREPDDLLRATRDPPDERPTAFGGIRRLAMATDLVGERPR